MSVLIKGIGMPKSCFECKLRANVIGPVCTVLNKRVGSTPSYMRPDCPLVEVPVPHGNLIDKETLLQDLFEVDDEIYQSGRGADFGDAFDEVELALPIIEAEKI